MRGHITCTSVSGASVPLALLSAHGIKRLAAKRPIPELLPGDQSMSKSPVYLVLEPQHAWELTSQSTWEKVSRRAQKVPGENCFLLPVVSAVLTFADGSVLTPPEVMELLVLCGGYVALTD